MEGKKMGKVGGGGALVQSRAAPESRVGGKLTPTLSGFQISNKTTCIIQNWLLPNIFHHYNFMTIFVIFS